MSTDWMPLNYDPETGARTEMKFNGDGTFTVRERMPVGDIMEEAKRRRNEFNKTEAYKHPYVHAAAVPLVTHDEWVKQSGFDPKTGMYDRKYLNKKFLNNPDFENYRLIPGKL